jgi:uncharacterized protein YkwD
MAAVVEKHNRYRRETNGGAPLTWDPAIAQTAQAHANRCVFSHSKPGGQGQNLYMGQSNERGVDLWYNEKPLYNGRFSMAAGHYSQLVWKATQKIGCGTSRCNGRVYLVCNYFPAGNVEGQFAQNV